jgi:hypothetical protein
VLVSGAQLTPHLWIAALRNCSFLAMGWSEGNLKIKVNLREVGGGFGFLEVSYITRTRIRAPGSCWYLAQVIKHLPSTCRALILVLRIHETP